MGRRKKFEITELVAEDISSDGRAIGRSEGRAVFVKDMVPGDNARVRVFRKRKSYLEAELLELNEESPDRIAANCPHFAHCGGCKWQNFKYDKLVELKDRHVRIGFQKLAHWEPTAYEPIIPAATHYGYRNKLEFTFSNKRWLSPEEIESGEEFDHRNALGFHVAGMFDKVIDVHYCLLQGSEENAIKNGLRTFSLDQGLSFYDIRENHGLMRNLVLRNNSKRDILVIMVFGEDQPEEIAQVMNFLKDNFKIQSLNYIINLKQNDSISDQEVIHFSGETYLTEDLLGLNFRIQPKSFFQTNQEQTAKLYQVGLDYADLKEDDVLYDLYCGTGTIGLTAADKVQKLIGVEYVQDAVDDAAENAKLNCIENAEFYAGDLKDILAESFVEKHGKPSVIMIDPPRAGMHKDVVEQVRLIGADRIVYISCNPSTQARDIELLKNDYDFIKSRAVDMFPQTSHIENVVLLKKKTKHEQDYWDKRWVDQQTGWDIGYPAPAFVEYAKQLTDKSIDILIPGCGNAYEAEHLHAEGFENVWVIDISPLALESFNERVPSFPLDHLIQGDFFALKKQFDLILEQTFFCAMNPSQREQYCRHMVKLLKENGKLVGVLFNDPLFTDHPPYGGSLEEYQNFFPNYFKINVLEACTNSIESRARREVFINFEAK